MASLELPILWEDKDIMVVNKPPFVVVNRADSVGGETVADWADEHLHTADGTWHMEDKDEKTFG